MRNLRTISNLRSIIPISRALKHPTRILTSLPPIFHNPSHTLTTLTPNEQRAQDYLRKYGLGRGTILPPTPSPTPTPPPQPSQPPTPSPSEPPPPTPHTPPTPPTPTPTPQPPPKSIPKVTGTPLTIPEITSLLHDNGGLDIQVIDVKAKASFTDEIVIASGRSQRHVESMAEMLVIEMKGRDVKVGGEVVRVYGGKKSGRGVLAVEEKDGWVIVDVGKVVVHCFTEEARGAYDLEGLWEG